MQSVKTLRTIEAYDRNAEKYSRKFDNYQTYIEKINDFQEKHIAKGSRILDVGCGPGNAMQEIYDSDPSCTFTGVDLSKGLLSIAMKRFPEFEFLRQDIRSLKLTEKYDVVIASFCIVHLTDEEASSFIRSIANYMNPGAVLYLSYMNGDDCGFESTSFSDDEIYFNYYSDDFINTALQQNSIGVLEIKKEEYPEEDGSTTIDTFVFAQKS